MKINLKEYYLSSRALQVFFVVMYLMTIPIKSTAQQILEIEVNVVGLNNNQRTALTQLDEACASIVDTTDEQAISLQAVCDLTDTLDQADPDDIITLRSIADAIAPEEAFSIDDSLVIGSDYQAVNINARLNALRQADSSEILTDTATFGLFPIGASNTLSSKESGGGAAGDLVKNLGGFISGRVSSAELNGGILQQNTNYDFSSLTIGADYRFGEQIIAGLGLGITQDRTRFIETTAESVSDGINVTAYTSWFDSDKAYLDIVLDMGLSDYELQRSISVFSDDTLVAVASPEVDARSLTMSAGSSFTPFGFDVSGYLRLVLTRATIGSYTESLQSQQSGFTPLFSIAKRNVISSEIALGIEVSKALSTSFAVIVPRLRLDYVNENDRSKDVVEATLISTGTVARYQGEDRVGSYTNFGAGVSAVFSRGRSAYVYYETHLQHGLISQDTLNLGARLAF